MRKYIWIWIVMCAVSLHMLAQTRSITFEQTRSWSKIVKKAKAEQKLIFVDCYASWCGPCKKLATEVFTQDKVADFFNEHFINAQFDMEKDADGKAHLQQWGISSFPTLMFIDPATEQPVGKLVGAGEADWLIDGAQTALDPSKRIDTLAARYNAGERDEAFLLTFIKALGQAGMIAQVQQVGKEWLSTLPIEKLATPQMWKLVMQFENDPLSKTLLTVRDSISRFYAIPLENQRVMVDSKLASAMVQTAMEFATSPNLAAYNQERYNQFVDYLAQMPDSPGKTAASVWLNTSLLSRQNNWKQMLEVMRAVDKEKILPDQIYGQYFVFFLKSLTQMKDKENAVAEGVKWLDELIAGASGSRVEDYKTRASMYAAKASLWQAVEKSGEMKKAQKEMEKYVELMKKVSAVEPIAVASNPAASQAGSSVAGETILNYDDSQGVPIVKVVINGHTYSFLFDTCAGVSCVSDKLVNVEKLAYQQTGNTLQGMEGALTMAAIPELSLGEWVVRQKTAAVMSEHNQIFRTLKVDGIIGATIINDYVLTIDSRSKTITLARQADASITQWNTLKLWQTDPLISIKVRGKEEVYDVPALFDTGNGTGTIALPSAKGFEEWVTAGIISDVVKGEGFNAMMIGGVVKTTEQLYRGKMAEFHIGDGIFKGLPMMTGGVDYLLLPFKITDLGKITLDYANQRFSFTAYPATKVWEGDRRPVMTGADNGELKIAALWGDEARKELAIGSVITAVGDKPLENVPFEVPNIDVLVKQSGATAVTVKDAEGKTKQVAAEVFLGK